MSIKQKTIAVGCVFVCVAALSVYGQEKSTTNENSLGDIARQIRAQKAKEPKPVLVVTSDTIVRSDESTAISTNDSDGKKPAGTKPAAPGVKPPVHDELYYHSQMSALQERLDTDKRELDVLQQKLGQNQTQYNPDPNKTLHQEYSRDNINKLNADIDGKKLQVASDEKAIEDLRDQLRHEGGDSSWLR